MIQRIRAYFRRRRLARLSFVIPPELALFTLDRIRDERAALARQHSGRVIREIDLGIDSRIVVEQHYRAIIDDIVRESARVETGFTLSEEGIRLVVEYLAKHPGTVSAWRAERSLKETDDHNRALDLETYLKKLSDGAVNLEQYADTFEKAGNFERAAEYRAAAKVLHDDVVREMDRLGFGRTR